MKLRCFIVAAAGCLPVAALAEVPQSAAPVGPGDVLSVGSGLLLVIAAILVCGWLYRRSGNLRGVQGGVIRVVASQALGTRERVVLLQVADKQLLVGLTPSQVQTLHVFDEAVATPAESGPGFAARLRDAMKGERR